MSADITIAIARKVLEVVDAGLVKGVGYPAPGEMCVEAAVCYAMGLPHGDMPPCVSPALRQLKIVLNDAPWSSDAARAAGLRRLAVAQLGSAGALDEGEFGKRVTALATGTMVPVALRAAAAVCPAHAELLRAAAVECETNLTAESARAARKIAYSAAASSDCSAASAADAAHAAAAASSSDCSAASAAYAAHAAAYAAHAAAAASSSDCSAAHAADAAVNAADAAVNGRDKHLKQFADGVVEILVQMDAPGVQWLALCDEGRAA